MMRRLLKDLYGFLPVQLLLLHLRKYQLLLFFWVLLVMVITGHFASTFGAESLFLSPEYMGEINFGSMFLLGGALAMFTMSWHITTFIIHSKRVPFLGAARHAFLKYCINNSLLPLAFIIFYSITYARYQWVNEHSSALRIISLLSSFFGGSLTGFVISFAYFFRADRNILKIILSGITNPKLIREIIPYDSLDAEFDVLLARTFLTGRCRVQNISSLERYNMRVMETVLRRHHRNAVFATLVAIILLLLLGIFMNVPQVRIPAGAGFLILFSIMLGIVGAFKYFLRSWEVLGWCVAILLVSLLVHRKVIDFRSTATGINYQGPAGAIPQYDYQHLQQLYTPAKKEADRQNNLLILEQWKQRRAAEGDSLPPLVIICASGGGSRAAYWTFRALQYADSVSKGKLFRNTVLMTGASGGMIGSAYWRSIRWKYYRKELNSLYDPSFQQNVGKDMLNAIIFSFVSIDLVAPFNEVKIGNRSYRKDRGYAMEEELIRNTNGVLDSRISDFKQAEQKAEIPMMLLGNTVINDGRRLLVSAQPMAHMTQPVSQSIGNMPVTDVVDLQSFFAAQSPGDLRLVSALRMNATFPYVLPVVKMPSQPAINIMDAGLRDNFGMESAMRFLTVFREWIAENTRDVIILQVRDTREHELFRPEEQNSLLSMAVDPMVVIHNKWGTFQTYSQTYMKDLAFCGLEHKLHFINFEYIPEKEDRSAALNFHLTQKEKEDLYRSMTRQQNQDMADTLLRYLKP